MGSHETLELNNHRIERSDDGCFVVDLMNAGKRGKNCRAWAIRSLAREPDAQRNAAWSFHVALKSLFLRGGGGSSIDELAVVYGMDVTHRETRGIDTAPAGWQPIIVSNAGMHFSAGWNGFSVRDLSDPNMSAAIPKNADKRAPVKCRAWARKNAATLERMTFWEVVRAMSAAGIQSHVYCMMD